MNRRLAPSGRLAGLLVKRLDLQPPIDIHELLREYADVEAVVWPIPNVDALMLRRPGLRPKVFFRPTPENLGRERFTLSHELGHLLLPWHIGGAACSPGFDFYDRQVANEEDQANFFASSLLAPERWIRGLIETHGDNMDAFLAAFEDAQMSATGSLVALRRQLLPGWAFQLNNQTAAFQSLGTGTAGTYVDSASLRRELDSRAQERGCLSFAGQTIRWWRLRVTASLPDPDTDPASDTDLIRRAIASSEESVERRRHLLNVANGKVGGGVNDLLGRSAETIYESLWHRFGTDQKLVGLMSEPEFPVWLARKSRSSAARSPR